VFTANHLAAGAEETIKPPLKATIHLQHEDPIA